MNFKDKKAFDYFYLEKEIKGKRSTIYLTQEEEILKKLKVKNFSRFVKDMILKETNISNKENNVSQEVKLEIHIKNVISRINLIVEKGNKYLAIRELKYFIKKLPYNYKGKKYQDLVNTKLLILNNLLIDISC
ncbi:hypothetical protein [Aliarcobacter butzleri]|uniref:hypothetical protein n=1 Tax=Aliarcobacter butzleri TaxID=28197 RepID=UPI003AF6487E